MNNSAPLTEYVGSVGYIVLGGPASVANFIIAASIAKYRALRTRKEFVMLMALAVADSLNTFCYMAAGIYRLILLFFFDPTVRVDVFYCARLPHMWLWSFSTGLASCMLVLISTDRLLLVMLRAKYIVGFGLKYAWGLVLVTYVSNILFGVLAVSVSVLYGDQGATTHAMCYIPEAFTDTSSHFLSNALFAYHSYGHSFLSLLSVFIFALVVPVYKHQKCKTEPTNEHNAALSLRRQHKLTKSMGMSGICTLLLSCIPTRVAYFAWHELEMFLLARLCLVVTLANPLANIIIYHFSVHDLRTAFNGFLHGKELPANLDLWPAKPQKVEAVQQRSY